MALLPTDPQKQKQLLIGLLPLLALFGYWYFYHGDLTAEIDEMASRLESLEASNRQARVIAQRFGPELERELEAYARHMTSIEQLIPSSEEVPRLLHTMTVRAQDTGIEIAFVDPLARENGPYYTMHTYQITVLGRYHDVGRFLTAIGSLSRIIAPVGLSLTTAQEQAESMEGIRLKADFRIQTYVLPQSQTEGQSNETA